MMPELLQGVRAGNNRTITNRGNAVAALVSVKNNKHSDNNAARVEEIRSIMRSHKQVGNVDLKSLINEGRA